MTDVAVGVAVRRSEADPGPVPVPATGPAGTGTSSYGVWGDELRVRAWLWRRLGVGAHAEGGTS
ncbi:hypothetical protein AB0M94_38985 [Streptomyces xanthochromogenes]|uniref:hypothetical protein n=1 Tax=Streptomyces xanthochromogenes TaxID=67384 RepID=UPI00343F6C6C